MENIPTPNADFENYLRKNLEQIDASPDDAVWAQIAVKQAQPNKWLKFRRFGMYAAGAVLFIAAVVGIWRNQHSASNALEQNTLQQEQVLAPTGETLPLVTTAPTEILNPVEKSHGTNKRVEIPNFSTRVNSVPAATVRFNTEAGLRYQSPVTGTSVSIPANSLVDQNGQPVNGEAELFFREYRSVEDYLASGIPMHYADGRGQFFFNSGGMFEVRVSQAGTALKMAAGRKYDIRFSPTETMNDPSLYYLDDATKTWRFKPDAAFGQANLSEPPVVTETTAINDNLRGQSKDCIPDPGQLADDPEPAELVKLGVQTGFDLATGKLTIPTWFKKNPYLTDNQLAFRMERGLIQIKKHRDQAQLFFPEDLNKYFTELAAFKNCYFSYNLDSLGGAKNAGLLTTGDYWQRITVAQENGANCIITLYDGQDGQMQFHAILSGSTENKGFNAEQVLGEYNRLKIIRQKDFARKNQALRYFLHVAAAFKTKEEWCYTVGEWLAYFEKNHPLMARRYDALIKEGLTTDDAVATQAWKKWQSFLRDQRFDKFESINPMLKSKNTLEYALYLSDFGVFNCDQIYRIGGEGTQYVVAEYKTPEGKKIIPAYINMMERRTQVLINLPSTAKLLYSKGRKLDVIVTDRNGRQYHFPGEKYAAQKFNTSGSTVLTLNDVTDQTQTPRAWAELLEM